MWPAAHAALYPLTLPLEADIPHMYRDRLGLVTWGIGFMDDPISRRLLAAPWTKGNGYPATQDEIRAEWHRIKIGPLGAGEAKTFASMHVPPDGRMAEFWRTADAMETTLKTQFAAWDQWPADAQLATMSHAWNMGANITKTWPDLAKHLQARDWGYCAQHCEPGAGPTQRSRQNKVLFYQALIGNGGDPKILRGPNPAPSTSKFAAATTAPNTYNAHAWWVQAMLIDTGDYTAAHDGKFGGISRMAWVRWAARTDHSGGYTLANLTSLSKGSLRVKIIA